MPNPHSPEIFGHLFRIKDQNFYYDVNTSRILELEPELAAVIPLYGTMSQAALVHTLKKNWKTEKILEACAIIETAQKEEGLFLALRPLLKPKTANLSKPKAYNTPLHHLVLTVTERCNLRCRYCVHGADLAWVRSHGNKSMTPDIALDSLKYYLDRVAPDKKPMVSFYGGEALLELDLIKLVINEGRRHPRGKDAMFIIDTNGILLTESAIDLVIRENVFLQISIDGPAKLHDKNRVDVEGIGSLSTILDNIDKLLVRDPTFHKKLSFVATMAPPFDLFALADFFAAFPPFVKHGIKSQPNVRVNSANLRGQDWPISVQDRASFLKQVTQAREQYLEAVAKGSRANLSPVIRELFEPGIIRLHHRSRSKLAREYTPGGNCLPGKRKLHVTVDGQFQPCERTGGVMTVGNLETGIEAKKVFDLQENFHDAVKDKCTDCWALRLCGVCFAAQAEYFKPGERAHSVPEVVCQEIRRDRDATIKMLGEILRLPKDKRQFLEDSVIM